MSGEKKGPTILEQIYAQRREDVQVAKSTLGTTPDDIAALLASNCAPPLVPFVDRLKRNPSSLSSSSSPTPSLMAEIKRASPSKGNIAPTANPAAQALTYALAGASVISVLTEPRWFHGSLLDLRLAREAVAHLPDRPAILRKEFVLDEYQIAEARLHGADTVLLIVAMLPLERLKALYTYATACVGIEPLVEVNNAEEMRVALDLGARAIGVNNRNLHDFEVDMGTTTRLADMVAGRDVVLCALSGISTPQDVRTYAAQGVRGVLVGESLMRAKDTAAFARELLGWTVDPASGPGAVVAAAARSPRVLVSGVASAADARKYAEAGAHIIGVVFDGAAAASSSPGSGSGSVSIDTARAIVDAADAHRKQTLPPSSSFSPSPVSPPSPPAPWFTAQLSHLYPPSPAKPAGASPQVAGIFRNHALQDVVRIVRELKLDLVVLEFCSGSGPSPPLCTWSRHVPVPVVRRVRVQPGQDEKNQQRHVGISEEDFVPGSHSFILVEIESSSSGLESGLASIAALTARGEAGAGPQWPLPIVLSAAGVTAANWQQAASDVNAWAFEVSLERGDDALGLLAALGQRNG